MRKTKLVGADCHDFRFGKGGNLVKITFYHMHIAANAAKELQGFLTAKIPGAHDVLDLSGGQKLLDLGVEVPYTVRDVEIADNESKNHVSLLFCVSQSRWKATAAPAVVKCEIALASNLGAGLRKNTTRRQQPRSVPHSSHWQAKGRAPQQPSRAAPPSFLLAMSLLLTPAHN